MNGSATLPVAAGRSAGASRTVTVGADLAVTVTTVTGLARDALAAASLPVTAAAPVGSSASLFAGAPLAAAASTGSDWGSAATLPVQAAASAAVGRTVWAGADLPATALPDPASRFGNGRTGGSLLVGASPSGFASSTGTVNSSPPLPYVLPVVLDAAPFVASLPAEGRRDRFGDALLEATAGADATSLRDGLIDAALPGLAQADSATSFQALLDADLPAQAGAPSSVLLNRRLDGALAASAASGQAAALAGVLGAQLVGVAGGMTGDASALVPPKSATLLDRFTAQDEATWSGWGGGAAVLGGRFVRDLSTSPAAGGIRSTYGLDLTGSSLSVRAVEVPSHVVGNMMGFHLVDGGGSRAGFGWTGEGRLYFQATGLADEWVTFDQQVHAYWRVSESGGSLTWETSPDGIAWTTRRQATPAGVNLSYGFVELTAEGVGALPGTAVFDNVNVTPVTVDALLEAAASPSGATRFTARAAASLPVVVEEQAGDFANWSTGAEAALGAATSGTANAAWATGSETAATAAATAGGNRNGLVGAGLAATASPQAQARVVARSSASLPVTAAPAGTAHRDARVAASLNAQVSHPVEALRLVYAGGSLAVYAWRPNMPQRDARVEAAELVVTGGADAGEPIRGQYAGTEVVVLVEQVAGGAAWFVHGTGFLPFFYAPAAGT